MQTLNRKYGNCCMQSNNNKYTLPQTASKLVNCKTDNEIKLSRKQQTCSPSFFKIE